MRVCCVWRGLLLALVVSVVSIISAADNLTLTNQQLTVAVREQDGGYAISAKNGNTAVVRSLVAAQINHRWLKSNEFPTHRITRSDFENVLGKGQQLAVMLSGLPDRPRLSYILRLYDQLPFGEIEVRVENNTPKPVTVQTIRTLEAFGNPILNLGARESSDRVLSDSFSEANVKIYDLGQIPEGMHRGVGSQLVYNRDSRQSLFFGALTSNRFLTILRLEADTAQSEPKTKSYTIDSTGTTEARSQAPWFRRLPPEQRVQLSLPIAAGATLSSERLMFSVGTDYHAQLEAYGAAIRRLHHARVNGDNLMGWWSWTAYYMTINEGKVYTNAQWLAQHLRSQGFDFFHLDEGYQYSRGEDTTPNAAKFPHGMGPLAGDISRLGLKLGLWIAPLQVGERAWIAQQHKQWLVRNTRGQPLSFFASRDEGRFFVLDATHPAAQEYLRKTFTTFVREWGARYIKLDFMDLTAVEGYYYRPHTTALEAQRMALKIIRETVGEDVHLDKDGSPMLNPVGLVDEGRISGDTKHSYAAWKAAATGLLARYYMHRNFFVNDPDAFTLQREVPPTQIESDNTRSAPLSLSEAQMSIAMAALSGGMFEIGDDLPTLASDPQRMALVTNRDLLQIAKLGRTSRPIDLLDFFPEDLQPSITFLREDDRQSVLAVFNWTDELRSHRIDLAKLGLPPGQAYALYDVFDENRPLAADVDAVVLRDQAPHSVKLIKIIDQSKPTMPPTILVNGPKSAKVGESVVFKATSAPDGVPVFDYHWDFGDGTSADGASFTHTYTHQGKFSVTLNVNGLDGLPLQTTVSVVVDGTIAIGQPVRYPEQLMNETAPRRRDHMQSGNSF